MIDILVIIIIIALLITYYILLQKATKIKAELLADEKVKKILNDLIDRKGYTENLVKDETRKITIDKERYGYRYEEEEEK